MNSELLPHGPDGQSVNGRTVACPCGARYSEPLPVDGSGIRICGACGKGFRFTVKIRGYETTNATVTRTPLEPPKEDRAVSGALKGGGR